ncbi:MAG: hypothetical protein V2A74_11405 [bacterium]
MTDKDSASSKDFMTAKLSDAGGEEESAPPTIASATLADPESAAFDIEADGIDVEALLKKIRRNILVKKRAGIYRDEPIIDEDFRSVKTAISSKRQTDRLMILRGYQDILRIEAPLASHRPFVGPLIVAAKKAFLWFFKKAMAPIFSRQGAYNSILLDYLEDLHKDVDDLRRKVDRLGAAQPGQKATSAPEKTTEEKP